jgi:asparagine synthase (glutamine-hydrolysing)
MQVGFTIISQGEELALHLFDHQERDRPALVTHCRTPEYTVVFMGRLYYRAELLAKLDAAQLPVAADSSEANAAALALATYCCFGMSGIAHLEGDFALVIWDARAKRIVAARDPLGGYPLFWTEYGGTIAVSTCLQPLLALLPHLTLNLDYVAEFLILPSLTVAQVGGEACVFEGIHRVLAGSIATVERPAGRMQQQPFWHWLDQVVQPETDRLEDIAAQFAEIFRRAVCERLHQRPACHLSGGMDSTAVALTTRDWLMASHGAPPLHTLSLVYERLTGLARETPYLESALQQQAHIVAHRIPADDLLDFDGFTTPPLLDEPWLGLPRLAAEHAIVEAAAQAGATSILTGIGADQILEVLPISIADLLRQGQLRGAWSQASQWARTNTCSVWTILYPFGIVPLLPGWLHGRYASWRQQNDYTIAPWIRADFAHCYGLRHRAIANVRRMYASCQSIEQSVALFMATCRNGDAARWYLAAPHGVVTTHPFLDPRVICFVLGAHIRFRAPFDHPKPILAEAMRGVLPEMIRNRRRKGDFNELYFLGLARNLPALEALIQHSPIDDLGLFEKQSLMYCLHQAALGIAKGMSALSRLHLTLVFLAWLQGQNARPHHAAPAAKIIHISPQDQTVHAAIGEPRACIHRGGAS